MILAVGAIATGFASRDRARDPSPLGWVGIGLGGLFVVGAIGLVVLGGLAG